jgi:hypothetical protein
MGWVAPSDLYSPRGAMSRRPARPETEGTRRCCPSSVARRSTERALAYRGPDLEQDRPSSPSPPLRRACVRPRRDDLRVGACAECRPAIRRCRGHQHHLRIDAHGSTPRDDGCRRRPSRLSPRPPRRRRFNHSAERLEPDQARQRHSRLQLTDPGALLQGRRRFRACELQLVLAYDGNRCRSDPRFQGHRQRDAGGFAQRRVHAPELVRRRAFGYDDGEGRHRRRFLRSSLEQTSAIACAYDGGVRRSLDRWLLESRCQGRGVYPGECRGHR